MDRIPSVTKSLLVVVLFIRIVCSILSLLVNKVPHKGLVDIGSSTLGHYLTVPSPLIIHFTDSQVYKNDISLYNLTQAKKSSDEFIRRMYLRISEIDHSLSNLEINIERVERKYRFLFSLLETKKRIHISLIYLLGQIMGYEIFRPN